MGVPKSDCHFTWRQWESQKAGAVLLFVHGLGAHPGRWEAAGEFFAKRGMVSYAIELRRQNSFKGHYRDILRLYDVASKANPSKKIFLVGESMGALISFILVSAHPGLFSGLVCLSPAFTNRHNLAFLDFLKTFAPLLYNPTKEFPVPFDSSMCTRDPVYRKKLDEDTREYRTVSSRAAFGILLAQLGARAAKNKMTTPVLFLIAGEDRIVDPQATREIFNGLTIQEKALVAFPEMYHSLSIDIGKEVVFEEMLKWVEKRI